jgi:long-chain acyl-CoA synthetase
VVIRGDNSIEWAVTYFATHAIGGIAVPIDPLTTGASLQSILARTEPRLVLSDDDDSSGMRFPRVAALTGSAPVLPRLAPDDVADILFTTGTTANPKGVVLTHGNIAHAAKNTSAYLGQASSDVEIMPLSLSHSFGLGRLRCAALVGTTLVLDQGMRNPSSLMDALESHQATGLSLVPAGFAFLKRIAGDRLARAGRYLRYVEIGSAALAPDLRAWLAASLPSARLCHHYGLTEASRATFVELHSDEGRAGSIGRPQPGVTVTVRDEIGQIVGDGTSGELWVEGDVVARSYLDDPELTRLSIAGGRIRTGDTGYIGGDGAIYLLGRRSDTINVAGLKVSPVEVETMLNRYAGIIESACIGIPHAISGERVAAFYVSDSPIDATSVTAWLRANGLEPHKIPLRLERVSELPKTRSGKLLRRLLLDQVGAPCGRPTVDDVS